MIKLFSTVVRSQDGPTYVRVTVKDGVAMVTSTGCNERLLVQESGELVISTSAQPSVAIPLLITAELWPRED
jgi:hypothetical protein